MTPRTHPKTKESEENHVLLGKTSDFHEAYNRDLHLLHLLQ